MDLLSEIKKSNKGAFNELASRHHHILYKTARIFLKDDKDINSVIKETLAISYQDIFNVKEENDFLPWLLQNLIPRAQKKAEENRKNIDKKIANSEISFNIGDKITYTSTATDTMDYEAYRRASIVEEYISSIEENLRLIAILYYYANLPSSTIAKILRVPEFTINTKIDKIRIKLYEIIKNKEVDL